MPSRTLPTLLAEVRACTVCAEHLPLGPRRSGDLPPRPECAPVWRQAVLERLDSVELTHVLGRHAQRWHLDAGSSGVTELVADWRRHWPHVLPLPHPSPRNNPWLRRNPGFEAEVLPELRTRVGELV